VTPKMTATALSKDEIRDRILRHLYSLHEQARGPKAILTGIRDLQKAMKPQGISGTEVTSHLDYLEQKEWVKEVATSRPYKTPGGMVVESAAKKYKISAVGIDLLEGASAYQRPERARTINITNIQGVALVGDGNVVNTQFTDVARELDELEAAVSSSDELTDAVKLNVLADISTIQSQIQKPDPDKGTIARAWSAIEKGANIGQLAEIAARIGPVILGFAAAAV